MEFKKIVAGIKDIQVCFNYLIKYSLYLFVKKIKIFLFKFQGDFRIILKPICSRIPFCATMTIFLVRMPVNKFIIRDILFLSMALFY